MKNKFMQIAYKEALAGLRENHGGPFGAVVVQNGTIIARAHNQVIDSRDPTAHAEILAIRRAASQLKTFDLSGCDIYSTCEPCPMCLGAIIWAKIKNLYYACTQEDAAKIGFDDQLIYQTIRGERDKTVIHTTQMGREACLPLFEMWTQKEDKVPY
jgi:guanine deaminase